MKKIYYLILPLIVWSINSSGQVGINTSNPQGIFHIDGEKDNLITGLPTAAQQANDVLITNEGNTGIGISVPTSKVEISSGTPDISGLIFNNLDNTSSPDVTAARLGVDASGSVFVQNPNPILTSFKSFSIDGNVAANSVVTIGGLEFRYASGCINGTSHPQIRSVSGTNNITILHGGFRTSQIGATFINSTSITLTPSFVNLTVVPLNCYNNGHASFSFFSYTDMSLYRVNIHVADGDNLGFGAQGYIFVEKQN